MHSKILKNKVSIKLLYVLLFSIFFSSYLFANDSLQKSIEQGKIKSQTCIACHGVDGNSVNPQWPSIAQQSKSYIVNQLKYFRDGKRKNVLMSAQAVNLKDQDIEDLANYYNSLNSKVNKITGSDELVLLGEKIYRGGLIKRGVPACIACHGPKGIGNDFSGYPKISGQHSVYLKARLEEYKRNYDTRKSISEHYSLMSEIIFKLSLLEIKALSEYIQGLH